MLGYEQHAFTKMLAILLLLSGNHIFLRSRSNYFYVGYKNCPKFNQKAFFVTPLSFRNLLGQKLQE